MWSSWVIDRATVSTSPQEDTEAFQEWVLIDRYVFAIDELFVAPPYLLNVLLFAAPLSFCWVQNQEHQWLFKFLIGPPYKFEWMHSRILRPNKMPTSRAALPGWPCPLAVLAASGRVIYLQNFLNRHRNPIVLLHNTTSSSAAIYLESPQLSDSA